MILTIISEILARSRLIRNGVGWRRGGEEERRCKEIVVDAENIIESVNDEKETDAALRRSDKSSWA